MVKSLVLAACIAFAGAGHALAQGDDPACGVAASLISADFRLPHVAAAINKKHLTIAVVGSASSTLPDAKKAYPARLEGALTAKLPGVEILPGHLEKTDRGLAKKNGEDALARYPDLVLRMGLWSYNGPCMADAVRSSTRKEKPVMIAFDEEEETLKAVQDGMIFSTIVQRPFQFGYQSIKALKDLKDGKTVPPVVDTGILTVKKDNVAQFWSELRELKK